MEKIVLYGNEKPTEEEAIYEISYEVGKALLSLENVRRCLGHKSLLSSLGYTHLTKEATPEQRQAMEIITTIINRDKI
jgi:hypothetical protein